MTKYLVLAALLLTLPARADDPPPGADPSTNTSSGDDDPGMPGENTTPAPAPEEPAPAPKPAARLANPTPHAVAKRTKDDGDSPLDKREDEVAGGKHWRIKTAQGAVHVWVPEGYDRETAGTVVYVHGYYTDADGAWRDYDLARQFRKSHQNAMFIVPDAPAGNDDSVNWPALKDLRHAVARANIHLPDGPLIVMGHSGAFRTVMQWVDHRMVEQIILLDAMYAGESAFDEYIGTGKRADEHKLIVVGASTAQESAGFAKKYKFAIAREKMPDGVSGFTRHERNAKLLYIRSQYEHMAIVTSGKVIPVLLHLTPLKSL
ncbi:MAG TPA: hypothetical protein VMJ10_08785 [Kofleriaceae bacterium]|nr:hypothetical protein [Kofleriaceae bacterium]